jgi:iron complex outermembrane receptor protein
MQVNSPRLRRKHAGLFILIQALFVSGITGHAMAADEVLPAVEVKGEAPAEPSLLGTADDNGTTTYRINQEGVKLLGGNGGSNPYTVIDRLPSVNAQTVDAYGLANTPGGNKGLRVRGELNTHGSTGTVDGMPLTGINPGPGSQWLFDLENIGGASMQQGPISPDRVGFFTTGGSFDSEIRWPQEHNFEASQSFGSSKFRRTFARFDSGKLEDGSDLFLSVSRTDADKWRGYGKAPGGRTNVEGALSWLIGGQGKGKVLFSYNDARANNYRALTYAQASDLNTWRNYDYSATSSSTASTAVNYYNYNRQAFQNWTLIGEFEYALSDSSTLSFKPYYLSEKGDYFDGMANGKVRQWLIDHDWYGITTELHSHIAQTGVKLGYWGEASTPPGPPTSWKMYNPTASGELTGASWSILADTTTRHRFNSVYALADQTFGDLKAQAGGRYVRETMPGMNFYNATGLGDISYSQALASSSGIVANRSASSFSVGEFLPFAALDYALTPSTALKASVGRNYGAPSFDVWPVFQQNSPAFLAKGIDANTLWHSTKPETSNALDAGIRMSSEQGYIEPTLFYARNHNKNVSYDPGVGIAYSQNIGETHAYGIQAAGGLNVSNMLNLFATASYNRNVFSSDLPLLNGSTLAVTGMQLPDTPKVQGNIGGTWHQGEYSVSPLLRYNGARYGDTLQTQRIGGYSVVDLSLGYKHQVGASKLGASLSVQNLFDKRYIGFINASYYQLMSSTSAFYYPGAPRTVVAKLTLDY